MVYQIKVVGELDQSWSDWLGGIQAHCERMEDGPTVTTLTIEVADQPALFGILDHIRDINLFLISVTCTGDGALQPHPD
jgi:hypothetical protein